VELEKTSVGVGQDAIVKLRYEPAGKPVPSGLTVKLIIQPFNQTFPISVAFAGPAKESSNQ
jgi:hypothetical protein